MIEIPDLLPDILRHATVEDKKEYINRVMGDLVRSGQFFLTAFMMQPAAVQDLVGEVIHGRGIDRDLKAYVDGAFATDSDLQQATVFLESIKWDAATEAFIPSGENISYANGMRSTNTMATIGNYGHEIAVGISASAMMGQKIMVDNIIDTKRPSGPFPLRMAWLVLKEKGFAVNPAVRADHRQRVWKVREVHPSELAKRGQEKAKKSA